MHRSLRGTSTPCSPAARRGRALLSIAATLALAAPLTSHAQSATSNVTLFGAIDGFVESAWTGQGRLIRQGSGGISTTRWGLSANEDLGGGLSAGVLLEQTFALDTGVLNNGGRAFGRTSLVRLEHKSYGRLELGRMAATVLETLAAFQMARYGSGNFLYNPSNTLTHDNSLKYTAPSWGPLTLTLRHDFGESSQGSSIGRSVGAQAQWRDESLTAVASFSRSNSPTDITLTGDSVSIASLGASYRFGGIQPLLLVQRVRSRTAPLSVDQLMVNAGVNIAVGADQLRFEAESLRNHALADADGRALSVRYDHSLSKRTTLYAGAVKIRNEANVYYPIVGASGSSPVAAPFPAAYRGTDPASVIVGLLHTF